jgi:hypothetical protein
MKINPKRRYTVKESSKVLGITVESIYDRIHDETIICVNEIQPGPEDTFFVMGHELIRFLDEREFNGTNYGIVGTLHKQFEIKESTGELKVIRV